MTSVYLIKIKAFLVVILTFTTFILQAQHSHHLEEMPLKQLTFSGFGEIHYNQPVGNNVLHNGKLDIHRLVVGMGYKFNEHFSFMAEVAYEHVSEVLIEQVNVNYKHNEAFQIQAGILPVPMGIVNQEHEPNMFNGLEHPALNEFIIPTAWRELAIGIHGEFENVGLHYQLSVTNGFSTYREGEGLATGATAFRMARQEGVESFISHPNVTGRLAYEGIDGLTLGASFYAGKSQSDLYDSSPTKVADKTVVGMTMAGFDLRYQWQKFHFRGEYAYAKLSNVADYNSYTNQDLGTAFMGYYTEIAYNFTKPNGNIMLTPFFRHGNYNTHYKVTDMMTANKLYHKTYYTFGLGYRPMKQIIIKADYQYVNDAAANSYDLFNAGVNFVF